MNDFKINSIEFNDGTVLKPERINIIVGPNSCGKSRTLKDIKNLFGNRINDNEMIVIKNIDYNIPDNYDEFVEKYKIDSRIFRFNSNIYIKNYYGVNFSLTNTDFSMNNYMDNNCINMSSNWQEELKNELSKAVGGNQTVEGFQIPDGATDVKVIQSTKIEYKNKGEFVEQEIGGTSGSYISSRDDSNKRFFINKYGTLFFQYLGTEEKLFICKRQKRYGLESTNLNLLSESQLHIDDIKDLSNITKELFGKYIYLDRTSYGDSLVFRVSDDFDFYNKIVLNDSKSEELLLNYPLLDEDGDGIKNFVSTYLAIKSMNKRLILIDEPESFLHPPLARRFGEILAKMVKSDQQLFIVTHSEDIINGIISKIPATYFNIMRIEKHLNDNNIFIMSHDVRLKLKKSPIILMSNILKGLFSEKVYITESFSDSALYQNLMIKYNDYSSFYFVNTESKDKIGDVIKIYDLMGVNNIAIYDFDYFRNDNTIRNSLKNKLGATKEYQQIYDKFKEARSYIETIAKDNIDGFNYMIKKKQDEELSKMKDELYHKKGISCIKNKKVNRELNKLINDLKKYGIYILKTGELETVLKDIGYESSSNKKTWIDGALEFVDSIDKDKLKKSKIIDLISGRI